MTTCGLPITPGEVQITAAGLADLTIDCTTGYALTELQVGFAAGREVVRPRALGNGIIDNTAFHGSRAITLSLRLDTSLDPTQTLLDQVLAFCLQTRRPRIAWRLGDTPFPPAPPLPIPYPTSDGRWRSVVVRAADAPVVITGPRYTTIVCSFTSVDSFLETRDLSLWAAVPRAAAISVWHQGNAPAPWVVDFTGESINPVIQVNGVSLSFPAYTLAINRKVTIDLAARTMIESSDLGAAPFVNVYPQSNSYSWSWESLYLQPGLNTFRYNPAAPAPANNANLSFRDAWV